MNRTSNFGFQFLIAVVVCFSIGQSGLAAMQATTPSATDAEAVNYDPLDVPKEKVRTIELTIDDKNRGREIPVLVYMPSDAKPTAVIIHSHGLGGTKKTSPFLGRHWAARGYVAVFVQHPGSDDSVWKDVPPRKRMKAMQEAASKRSLDFRTGDISVVIDQLEQWNEKEKHELHQRMDLKRIGMSGHSFGAVTTQHVSGQATRGVARSVDKRIRAAMPMSPSSPRAGDPVDAFGQISMPWMCMTGTHDVSPIGNMEVKARLAVFKSLPPGNKFELVLDRAEHSAFTEQAMRADSLRNPNHHRAIKAISTAFWDTYLGEDAAAKEWLGGDEVRTVLDPKDRWQTK